MVDCQAHFSWLAVKIRPYTRQSHAVGQGLYGSWAFTLAIYMTASVACGWAGAVWHLGRGSNSNLLIFQL